VRGRPQERRTAHRPWLWVTLLALVAAMIPLAAMEGGEHAVAQAAIASPVSPILEPAPVPPVAEIIPDQPASERPPAPRAPTVEWRDSRAVGTPNAGSLENGVRLPASGVGYYTYNPATQEPPGGSDRTWGTARLVRELIDLGKWWARTHPKQPPLGIGDLSRETGGAFHGPVVGHQSHQNGLDVDIRLVRRDGAQASVDPSTYDRALTQAVVDRLVSRGASLVLIGPSLDLRGPSGVVMPWPAHDDHLHVRFPG
jgi:murein endopeptidase